MSSFARNLILLSILIAASAAQTRTERYFRPTPSSPCPVETCHTLMEVLEDDTLAETVFSSNTLLVFLSGNHVVDFTNGGYLTIRDLANVSFIGSPEVIPGTVGLNGPASRIICRSPFVMELVNISRLAFTNITFSGCGANLTNELYTDAFRIQTHGIHYFGPEQKAALVLVNIDTFQMIRCSIEDSKGYGLLAVNVLGNSAVLGSIFAGNNNYTVGEKRCTSSPVNFPNDVTACSGGNALFVFEDLPECPSIPQQYSLLIRNSVFVLGVNGYGGRLADLLLTRGTGIGLILSQNSYGVTITLDSVVAYGNSALIAANIYIAVYDVVDNSTIHIQNSSSSRANGGLLTVNSFFEQSNSASGGLHMEYGLPFLASFASPVCAKKRKHNRDIINIINSDFNDNVALLGAGAFFEIRVGTDVRFDDPGHVVKFSIKNCTFSGNIGVTGIGIHVSQQDNFEGVGTSQVIIENVNIKFNSYVTPIRNLTELYTSYQLNVVQMISADNVTFIDCNFVGNGASALSVFDSNVGMSGLVNFISNSGIEGGAIEMQNSHLVLSPNTRVNLLDNYALYNGGALKVTGRNDLAVLCFFQVNDPLLNPNITLHFEGNYAEQAGSVLYGGSIDRCIVNPQTFLSLNSSSEVFDFLTDIGPHSNETSTISSDPLIVCLCVGDKPDCTQREVNVSLFSGASVTIPPIVTIGQRNGTTPSNVYIITDQKTRLGEFQEVQQVKKTCTLLNLTVSSNSTNSRLLIRTGNLAVDGSLSVNFVILPCPLGFVNISGECTCDPITQLADYSITCSIDNRTIQREGGSWISASYLGPNGSYNGVSLLAICPYDYCISATTNVDLLEPDTQCDLNRRGTLCGGCKPGLTVSLANSQCIECSNNYLALMIVYAISGVLLVIILFFLDFTIAKGTLSGIIFYANIVHDNKFLFFPPGASNVITVFVSWLSLSEGLVGCFYDGLDSFGKAWLGFIYPFYIWIIVIIIIVASRFSSRVARVCGSKSVPVLATLILLSYNKLLIFIIIVLSSASIINPDGSFHVVWSFDGNMDYWKGKHIPLAIFANIVLIFFVIPYTFLLLVVPLSCIQARSTHHFLSWVNKLKPFMDAHQGPFKNSYRNWTGILLVVRIFLSIILSSVNIGKSHTNFYLLAIATVMVLLLSFGWVSGGGVYKKWPHNVLECSFYLNLAILSIATLYVRQTNGARQDALILTSGSIALAQFIGIIFFHVAERVYSLKWIKKLMTKMTEKVRTDKKTMQEEPIKFATTSDYPSTSFVDLREPLIDDTS